MGTRFIMIDESFRIYVEQLRDGQIEALDESLPPDFMDIHEAELDFVDPVNVTGEAYLADDTLVLHLNINTLCKVPCRICNEFVKTAVLIKGAYHAIPLDEIKGAVFDFREILRETILLETPALVECHQGKCPKRQTMQKFFKQEGSSTQSRDDEGYRPFANLDLND